MQLRKLTPFITTSKLAESKAFFVDHFGFATTFDAEGYVGLQHPESGAEIAFMAPPDADHPKFGGAGLSYGLEVPDVDAEYARVRDRGIAVVQELRDNPWGDRSFVVRDPSGVQLYIHQTIEPAEEYKQYFTG